MFLVFVLGFGSWFWFLVFGSSLTYSPSSKTKLDCYIKAFSFDFLCHIMTYGINLRRSLQVECINIAVKKHSQRFGTNDHFLITPIIHVPSMYWTEEQGEAPSDIVNLVEIIDEINSAIREDNHERKEI